MLNRPATELRVAGLTELSTCDWPGELAATVFCQGCAWDCAYCHNPGLRPRQAPELRAWESVTEFLARRRGLLDGVVFSGGEATLQPALEEAMREVRGMGFRVGLHTAGMAPERFGNVLPLVDWVGFDVKAPFALYARVTGVDGSGERARESLRMLLASGVDYEVRTTVHAALLSVEEMLAVKTELLNFGVENFVVQHFRPQGVRTDRLPQVAGELRLPADFGEGFRCFCER